MNKGQNEINPVKGPTGETRIVNVVGPICETGDFFCQDREVPSFQPGDVIAMMSAGAYGFTMASTYNTQPLPAEILVDGSESRVVRKRQTLEELISPEEI